MLYYQCYLIRRFKDGDVYTVTWLPEKYTKIGQVLKLKVSDDVWIDGWEVVDIYQGKLEEKVLEHERDYLKQRKASDI